MQAHAFGASSRCPNKSFVNLSDCITLDVEPRRPNGKSVLVGRLISGKEVSRGTLLNVLKWAWSGLGEINVSDLGRNSFMFAFQNASSAQKVLEDGPWTINGVWLNLKEWSPDKTLVEIDTNTINVWIQFHGLTLDMMTEATGRILGGQVGGVVEVDSAGSLGDVWRSFLRVRVVLCWKNPLINGLWVKGRNRDPIWIDVKYERLGDFCFRCGCLDHIDRYCKIEKSKEGSRFGPSLRASQPRKGMLVINPGSRERNEADCGNGNTCSSVPEYKNNSWANLQDSHEERNGDETTEVSDLNAPCYPSVVGFGDPLREGEGTETKQNVEEKGGNVKLIRVDSMDGRLSRQGVDKAHRDSKDDASRSGDTDQNQCFVNILVDEDLISLDVFRKGVQGVTDHSCCSESFVQKVSSEEGLNSGNNNKEGHSADKDYIVEMPAEEGGSSASLALVPYDLHVALERLSLKRKLDLENHEWFVNKKVLVDEGTEDIRKINIRSVSRSEEISFGNKSVAAMGVGACNKINIRRFRKWRRTRVASLNSLQELNLVDVQVEQCGSMGKNGCGGWPQSATSPQ